MANHLLSVYDVSQKRSLVSVRLPDARYVRAVFISPDVLRLYMDTANGLDIAELDVRTRALHDTGSIASSASAVQLDSTAAHMLLGRTGLVTLHDARTGAPLEPLPISGYARTWHFLRDGRIAIVGGLRTATLHVLSPDGALQNEIPLGPAAQAMFIGDDGTRVVLAVRDRHTSLVAVDINRGVVERSMPIRDAVSAGNSDLRPPMEPLREVFYVDAKGRVMAWTPATRTTRVITGG
jgi:hypothetical protein